MLDAVLGGAPRGVGGAVEYLRLVQRRRVGEAEEGEEEEEEEGA